MRGKLFGLFGLFALLLTGCMPIESYQDTYRNSFSDRVFCISKCDDWKAHDLGSEVQTGYCEMREYQFKKAGISEKQLNLFIDECKRRANETFDYDNCIKRCVE